jgi:hypothetical protein
VALLIYFTDELVYSTKWCLRTPVFAKASTRQAGFIRQKARWIPLPDSGAGLILEFKSTEYQIA